ncbi:hypothetical protein BC938DRAFT_471670, partial [Jimgerdemannia flammicorona]
DRSAQCGSEPSDESDTEHVRAGHERNFDGPPKSHRKDIESSGFHRQTSSHASLRFLVRPIRGSGMLDRCDGWEAAERHTFPSLISFFVHLMLITNVLGWHYAPRTAPHGIPVGYVICNMKSASEAKIGDTFHHVHDPVEPLPGFEPAKSLRWYLPYGTERVPETGRINQQANAERRKRVGAQRNKEYEANIIITHPTVPFKVIYKDGTSKLVRNPADFPDADEQSRRVAKLQEPMVLATLIFPETRRGEQHEYMYMDEARVLMKYRLPLSEIVTDFYDELKSRSSGYASFDYEEAGYDVSDLIKMTVLLNSKPVDTLSVILHRSKVELVGRDWCKRLKRLIPRQLFEVAIQTAVGSKGLGVKERRDSQMRKYSIQYIFPLDETIIYFVASNAPGALTIMQMSYLHGNMLITVRWRCVAENETATEAEGRKETDENDWQCRAAADSLLRFHG